MRSKCVENGGHLTHWEIRSTISHFSLNHSSLSTKVPMTLRRTFISFIHFTLLEDLYSLISTPCASLGEYISCQLLSSPDTEATPYMSLKITVFNSI